MFSCDQCKYEASSKGMLKIHFNSLHKDICNICGQKKYSNKDLAQHYKAIHEVKKHKCSECDYQASTRVGSLDTRAQNMKV